MHECDECIWDLNTNHSLFVEVPAKPSQSHSLAGLNQTETQGGALTDSVATPSATQPPHISLQSPTGPNQPELQIKGNDVPSDSQSNTSGARALLDVSSTPDMRDMDELVVKAVAANWQKVALRLGVEGCVGEIILKKHPNDCEGSCRDMFDHWLRRERHTGEEERTWSTLLTALSQAGFVELERRLRREHFTK